MALTDRAIKNLKADTKDQFLADGSGLYLRVSKSGAKTFLYRSRKGGSARWVTVGEYPRTSLLDARKAVLELVGKALPGNVTFETAFESWCRRIDRDYARPEQAKRRVELHLSTLWNRKLSGITRADLSALLSNVAVTAPVQANRLLTDVKSLFSHAVEMGWLDESPAMLISRKVVGGPEPTRARVLNEDELRELIGQLRSDRFAEKTRLALTLMLLTGQRSGEVRGITSSEVLVSTSSKTWRLPAHRTKNGLAHDVHLNLLSTAVVTTAFKLFGSEPFEGMEPQVPGRAMTRIGFTPNATPHDLRRSMATHMAELGVQPHIIEKCLNHKLPGVAGTYNRATYAAETRAAWRLWTRFLLRLRKKPPDMAGG